jgi:hypothetical protein
VVEGKMFYFVSDPSEADSVADQLTSMIQDTITNKMLEEPPLIGVYWVDVGEASEPMKSEKDPETIKEPVSNIYLVWTGISVAGGLLGLSICLVVGNKRRNKNKKYGDFEDGAAKIEHVSQHFEKDTSFLPPVLCETLDDFDDMDAGEDMGPTMAEHLSQADEVSPKSMVDVDLA